jgi:class 3 adenylate cyclase/tetratricopeptide (TPR) repeat protein
MFADLVGFTAFAEQREPETVRATMTEFYDRARAIVRRYGGIVEKFIGDAVMAVWGATVAHEDDAERAVRAGLELTDAVARFGAGLEGAGLSVRVGVLSGVASVAPATPERGFVVGDLVNTASRLQAFAEPGTVVVGEATYRMLQGSVQFDSLGEQRFKGKAAPIEVWRAVHASDQTIRAAQGGLIPAFVGRTEELRLLQDALGATERTGRARLVSIVGEAGIGKTRLAWELRKYVEGLDRDVFWHEGRSPAYDQGLPLWALAEMVRQRAGICDTDDAAGSRAKLRTTVTQFVPAPATRRWIEPRLAALLGLDEAPAGERNEFFTAVRGFWQEIARRHPTVLVFEDFHWADEALIEFVTELVAHSSNYPILVLTLARPDLHELAPGWGAGRRHFAAMHLGPLTDEEMGELVTRLVQGIGDELLAAIIARANGIPLYAVELIRTLIADGDLEMADDACCRPTRDLSSIRVPDTVRAVIGARLDRLPEATRLVLQDAAVIGAVFTRTGLVSMSAMDGQLLDDRLDELVHRELLEFEGDPRSPERGQYRFVQSMIREVAYERLTPDERRLRHVRAAGYFAERGDAELVGAVAEHFAAAHRDTTDPDDARALAAEARAALSGAAERATRLHAHADALAMLEHAIELTTEPGVTAALNKRAARSASALAHHDDAVEYANRALDWYREYGDQGDVAAAAALVGEALCHAYRAAAAVDVLEPIVATQPLADDGSVIEAGAQLARAYLMTLRDEDAAAMSDHVLRHAERLDLVPTIVNTMITRGTALGNLGRLRESIALLQAAARDAREHDLPLAELRAASNLGHVFAHDDHLGAMEACRTGLELAKRFGDVRFIASFASSLASYLARDGRFDEAQALRDDVRDRIELPDGAIVWYDLGDLTIRAERGDAAAAEQAHDALRRASKDTDPQSLAWVPASRGNLDLLAGRAEAAYDDLMGSEEAHRYPDHLFVATEAAVLLRDIDRLEAVAEALEATPAHGRMITSIRAALDGSIAALTGEIDDAVTSFATALEFRYLRIDRARVQALFGTAVGRGDPTARAASDEAFATFSECGATAYLGVFAAGLPTASEALAATGRIDER